jgi:hypothetical protein
MHEMSFVAALQHNMRSGGKSSGRIVEIISLQETSAKREGTIWGRIVGEGGG